MKLFSHKTIKPSGWFNLLKNFAKANNVFVDFIQYILKLKVVVFFNIKKMPSLKASD